MLTQIHIRDFATIQELQLHLNNGCTMITGETGAGKSIFIEAIELALGGRASQNIVRPGKDKAEISLCFDVTHFPKVIERLQSMDLYQGAPECIIRRIITSDGRSRCYINGSPSTVQLVKELGERLFHLHGQHEQQVLLQAETQREMLDRYADQLLLAAEVKRLAEEWKTIDQQIKNLRDKSAERVQRGDYLRFQLDELQAVDLKPGEWETLEAEHHRLTHAEELLHHLQHTLQLIAEDDNQNALSLLNNIRKLLESIQPIESRANEWITVLNSILIQLGDLESDLRNYLEQTELDPEKLHAIETRVSQIFNLARKHKLNPPELVNFQKQLSDELNALNSSDEDIIQLEMQQKNVQQQYAEQAEKLSLARKKAAAKLEKEITATMRSLSLPHGEFKIELEKEPALLSSHGNEKIVFLIKTNPDQTLQALKVISGGELSRLSLAAHLALASRTNIPTLVFDEVDTGLSGATAEKIGKLLRKLGDSYQVFCVTHQPQVAACGHHHLFVEKYFVEKSTHTRLRLLGPEEKTREIARMLGGEKITEKTLAHAREVLQGV
ncbi:DNA repair protein RecN [Aquicella lusitana]|uniref:DNA repair protein RecN n=1 Tax=Aquicella lusitana TaxID=254246 RepID=A0A370GXQ1_9COXI|nr:DNA repair protein RecN [Aquicella lusitana]RDI48046.1 DNA replication and repair protein RecN [Aquicella lusitana]VVC72937.1 DNA repair protein RecN [Aquicella lusitana]